MLNAYRLECLPRLGVRVPDLGCVMLDLDLPDLSMLHPDWAYRSEVLSHVSGIQRGYGHVTLLYGLLRNANSILWAVDEVLGDWSRPPRLRSDRLEVFPSSMDEPYSCLVARVDAPSLLDAHRRLSFLPHVNTHPEYKPHVTLAYLHNDHVAEAKAQLRRTFVNDDGDFEMKFPVLGLNYGDDL